MNRDSFLFFCYQLVSLFTPPVYMSGKHLRWREILAAGPLFCPSSLFFLLSSFPPSLVPSFPWGDSLRGHKFAQILPPRTDRVRLTIFFWEGDTNPEQIVFLWMFFVVRITTGRQHTTTGTLLQSTIIPSTILKLERSVK